jgi:Manganese containing catalase
LFITVAKVHLVTQNLFSILAAIIILCCTQEIMFVSINELANQLPKDKPDNRAANALQEGLGGQFGEMRTMMQYLFQNFNFRGKAKPY